MNTRTSYSGIWNSTVSVLLIIGTYLFYSHGVDAVPDKYVLQVNVILAPLIGGFLGGVTMKGNLLERVLFIVPIPIATVFFLGGDPAKSGMEWILVGPLLLLLLLGCVCGFGSSFLVRSKDQNR